VGRPYSARSLLRESRRKNALRLTQVWNQKGAATIDRHLYALDAVGNRLRVDEFLSALGAVETSTPSAVGRDGSGQLGDGTVWTTDGRGCDAFLAYHYDRDQINGVDVSGLTLGLVARIPGNVLQGNWKVVVQVDNRATPEQKDLILGAHTGRFGGPLADLAPLIGEVVAIHDVPIEFNIEKGEGTIRMGDAVAAEMQPYKDAQGRPTKLVDTVFSTIPGSPAYPGKATSHRVNLPEQGWHWEFNGRNAVLGDFRFEG